MLIYILTLDGVFDIGLSSLIDVITTANELAAFENNVSPLDMRLVGLRKKVCTSQGFTQPISPLTSHARRCINTRTGRQNARPIGSSTRTQRGQRRRCTPAKMGC
jgi:hypothetical protein